MMTPLDAENRSARSDGSSSLPSSVINDRDGHNNSVMDVSKRDIIMSSRSYNDINHFSTSTSTSTFAVDSCSQLSTAKKYTTTGDEVSSTISERLLEQSLLEEQEQEDLDSTVVTYDNKSNGFSSRKRRRSSGVRFAQEVAVSEVIMIHKMKTTRHKQHQSDTNSSNGSVEENETEEEEEENAFSSSSSSALWYTPQELRRIQQSVVVAVRKYENEVGRLTRTHNNEVDLDDLDYIDSNSLDRFCFHKRKRRRMVRNQMLDTCYAVKEFVASTTKTTASRTTTAFQNYDHHQEMMLSQLLQRYSSPMVLEAVQSASLSLPSSASASTSASLS
jgi:hypothetical protein